MGRVSYAGRLFWQFVGLARETRSYWILPVVVALFLAGLVTISLKGAAPLIYAFF